MSFICRACKTGTTRLFSTTSRTSAQTQTSSTSAFTNSLEQLRTETASTQQTNYGAGLRRTGSLKSNVAARDSSRLPGFASPQRTLRSSPAEAARIAALQQQKAEKERVRQHREAMERQMPRRWQAGDVYSPHDLSGEEMYKWKQVRQQGKRTLDVCDVLQMNPLDHYKNFTLMSEYVSDTGRIRGRKETGLRPKNQRRMAKAIRRAVAFGLMPSVHKHPEILRRNIQRQERYSRY